MRITRKVLTWNLKRIYDFAPPLVLSVIIVSGAVLALRCHSAESISSSTVLRYDDVDVHSLGLLSYLPAELAISEDSVALAFYEVFRPAMRTHLSQAGLFSSGSPWVFLRVYCAEDGSIDRVLYSFRDSVTVGFEQAFVAELGTFVRSFRMPLVLSRKYSVDGDIPLIDPRVQGSVTGCYRSTAHFWRSTVWVNTDSTFTSRSWADNLHEDTAWGAWELHGDTLQLMPAGGWSGNRDSYGTLHLDSSKICDRYYWEADALYRWCDEGVHWNNLILWK